ncbi:MAG: hypothetical protein K2Y37_23995 [Pirellulales bacterium]|nr:hypothetical protein [Pirellulales bacterium]
MSTDANAVFTAALSLNESERLDLAARLLDSVGEDRAGLSLEDPGLLAELQRRSADATGAIPWSQLRSEL